MKKENKTQKYPSPEVYDHVRFTKARKVSCNCNEVPRELLYLSVMMAALIIAFLAIVTR